MSPAPSTTRRRAPDDGLRALFRRHLREGVFWTTVETGLVTQGVPDSNYLFDGGPEGWIEYKATRGHAVRFRPEQIGWHLRRCRYGGITWIAVRRRNESARDPCDELCLFQGADVESVVELGCRSPAAVLRCAGGPLRWHWRAVRRLLSSR